MSEQRAEYQAGAGREALTEEELRWLDGLRCPGFSGVQRAVAELRFSRERVAQLEAALVQAQQGLTVLNDHHTQVHHGGHLTHLDESVATAFIACRAALKEADDAR